MKLSLRTKWTAALLVTGTVPLALFALRTTKIQQQGLRDAEQQVEISVIDHAATILDRFAHEAEEATHAVGMVVTEGAIEDEESRLRLARDAVGRAPIAAVVGVYTNDGGLVIAIKHDDSGMSPSDKLAPEDMSDSRARWLAPQSGDKGPLVRYVEPVYDRGERRAWIVATMDVAQIGKRLADLSNDRFEGRRDGVLLVDDRARIIAGGGSGAFALGQSLSGRDLFAAHTLAPGAFARDLALSTEFTSQDGEAMSGSLRALPIFGWGLVVRRPQSAAYAALARSRRELAIWGGGFALLVLLLGAVLGARATRPIAKLVELTRAYAGRRFSARSEVKSGDELEALGGTLEQMADDLAASEVEIERRATAVTNLSRYLPNEVATAIAEGKAKMSLGGERRAISVLFADVVSFTTFAEGAPPERVVAFLNELFTVLTEVVFRHGGTVDKFVGDCIMAFFGAPTAASDHGARAVAAAEDMHRFVETNAPAWKEAYGVEVKLGIVVNSGEALVGNLGSESRMDYTAIGDVVNVAARLEGLAQPGQTLLTAEAAKAAGDAFRVHALGEHPLRGKRQPVAVFELR